MPTEKNNQEGEIPQAAPEPDDVFDMQNDTINAPKQLAYEKNNLAPKYDY